MSVQTETEGGPRRVPWTGYEGPMAPRESLKQLESERRLTVVLLKRVIGALGAWEEFDRASARTTARTVNAVPPTEDRPELERLQARILQTLLDLDRRIAERVAEGYRTLHN